MSEPRPVEEIPLTIQEQTAADPTRVQAINRWLRTMSPSGDNALVENWAAYAPKGITKADLREVVLNFKPRYADYDQDYDWTGPKISGLADKILRDEFAVRYPNGASEEEEKRFWEEEAVIELERPYIDKYQGCHMLGRGWKRGTLVLKGNFGRDEDIGDGMKGGKIHILGNAGPVGPFMTGGIIEIEGKGRKSDYWKGGEVIVHNNPIVLAPPPAKKVYETTITDEFGTLAPADLAKSYVEYQVAKQLGELGKARAHLKTVVEEEVRPPRPADLSPQVERNVASLGWYAISYEEPDLSTEQREYLAWPGLHPRRIEGAHEYIAECEAEMGRLKRELKRVTSGDQEVVGKYAGLETERRKSLKRAKEDKGEKEMDGARDMESDLRQLMNMIREGLIPQGEEGDKGWVLGFWEPRSTDGGVDMAIIGFYNGSERSFRTPSVKLKIRTYPKNRGRGIEIKDWRNAEEIADHPFNQYGKARKGKFYSLTINDGQVSFCRAGDIIDSSHEFPSEEILATQEGFGQAQMYAVRDIIGEAAAVLIEQVNT